MRGIGGVPTTVSIDGRIFTPAGDNEVEIKLGGFSNEVPQNANGTGRVVKTRQNASISGLELAAMTEDDLEFLTEACNAQRLFPVAIELASGEIYSGDMQITGDPPTASSMNATIAISLSGPQLGKQ